MHKAPSLSAQRSKYEWENAPDPFRLMRKEQVGRQADYFVIMRKRDKKKKGSSSQLYVCKQYGRARHDVINIKRECEILSAVDHPSVVHYEDFSYDPYSGPCIAKLWVVFYDKGDLAQFKKIKNQDMRLDWREGYQVFEQLAQALLYLHHGIYRTSDELRAAETVDVSVSPSWHPVLHRDIKPHNGKTDCILRTLALTEFPVFIAKRFNGYIDVKLGDFGLAKHETAGTDTYVGSDPYMAPV